MIRPNHTAGKYQIWDLNPALSKSKVHVPYTGSHCREDYIYTNHHNQHRNVTKEGIKLSWDNLEVLFEMDLKKKKADGIFQAELRKNMRRTLKKKQEAFGG